MQHYIAIQQTAWLWLSSRLPFYICLQRNAILKNFECTIGKLYLIKTWELVELNKKKVQPLQHCTTKTASYNNNKTGFRKFYGIHSFESIFQAMTSVNAVSYLNTLHQTQRILNFLSTINSSPLSLVSDHISAIKFNFSVYLLCQILVDVWQVSNN